MTKSPPRRGRYRKFPRVTFQSDLPTMTKQSFKEECDINNIMARYKASGIIEHIQAHQGRYMDLPSEIDYHANLLAVMSAQDAFSSLPAAIRARFDNDPAAFVGFVQDPDNQAEIDKMGLGLQAPMEPEVPAAPTPDPAPNPTAAD